MADDCDLPTAAPRPALTREQKWEMLESVKGLVLKLIKGKGHCRADRDDLFQDIQVELLKAADRYDPARGTKWSTFAGDVAGKVIANHARVRAGGSSPGDGGYVLPTLREDYCDETAAGHTPEPLAELIAREEQQEAEAAGLADWQAFADLFRERLQSPLLDRLTPETRRVVELVLNGFTPEQVAVRLGDEVKNVKLAIRNAVANLSRVAAPDVAKMAADHYAAVKAEQYRQASPAKRARLDAEAAARAEKAAARQARRAELDREAAATAERVAKKKAAREAREVEKKQRAELREQKRVAKLAQADTSAEVQAATAA